MWSAETTLDHVAASSSAERHTSRGALPAAMRAEGCKVSDDLASRLRAGWRPRLGNDTDFSPRRTTHRRTHEWTRT